MFDQRPLLPSPAAVAWPIRVQVRYHDIHHWYPECNYGQYTMLWDWLMGSLKPYPTDDEDSGTFPLKGMNGAPIVVPHKEKAG